MLRKLSQPKHVNNQTNNCMVFLQKFTAVGTWRNFQLRDQKIPLVDRILPHYKECSPKSYILYLDEQFNIIFSFTLGSLTW